MELGVGGVACFQLESESFFKTAGVGVRSRNIYRLQCLLNNLNYNIKFLKMITRPCFHATLLALQILGPGGIPPPEGPKAKQPRHFARDQRESCKGGKKRFSYQVPKRTSSDLNKTSFSCRNAIIFL